MRAFTCADSGVGDDGGVGPLVGAGDGVGALVHPLQAATVEGHEADAARHLRRRRAAADRTCGRHRVQGQGSGSDGETSQNSLGFCLVLFYFIYFYVSVAFLFYTYKTHTLINSN